MNFRLSTRLLLGASIAAAAVGCTDLNVSPKSSINAANVFNDPNAYKEYLAKLYAGLTVTGQSGPAGSADITTISDEGFSGYLRLLWNVQELPTDEAIIAWGDLTIQQLNFQTWTASNDFSSGMFARIYFQVANANEFLRQSTDAKLNSRGQSGLIPTMKQYRAEARFLRALSYYHAADLFGDVPLVDENYVTGGALPAQATRQEVFNFVESELKAIRADLPAVPEYGRAGQSADDMLLAHLYLNSKTWTGTDHYADAAALANAVIGSGHYSLDPNWQHLFMADNNTSPEIIFPVPSDAVHQQGWGNTTTIIHASVGGSMNPAAYGINGGWYGTRVRPQYVMLFGDSTPAFLAADPDVRAHPIYTNGQQFHITNVTDFSTGYGMPKYTNVDSHGNYRASNDFVDTDFPMFRLADAYLIRAEANFRSGGSVGGQTPLQDVNTVRARAGAAPLATLALQDLLDERGRELAWEAWRRSDLIRFGEFTGALVNNPLGTSWEWRGGTQAGAVTDAHLNLYPIPTGQLNVNPNLHQNPGYN